MFKRIIISVIILFAMSTADYILAQTGKPQYLIRTERADTVIGYMTIELFPAIAPLHSAYFDSLVNINFYDSLAFHRVVPDFVIQGGDPNSLNGPRETWGEGDPSQRNIPAEFSGVSHARGIIGAARDVDINSANSQFYINIADNGSLDWNYTAYGQVLEGMDLADFIVSVPRDANDNPLEKIEMFISRSGHTDIMPEVPVPISPMNGEEGYLDRDTLLWSPVEGAVLYNLQISKSSDFDSLFSQPQVSVNYYALRNLELGNVHYYWRVKANNGGNLSEYSESGHFYSSIEAAELIYPEVNDTVSVTPEFQWQPVAGASAYRLQISRSPLFSTNHIVYDVDTITSPVHVITGELEPGRSHYWRVYSSTEEYEGPVSEFRRFLTEDVTSIYDADRNPGEFRLNQNYPNPFNPSTVIGFELAEESRVTLSIYNMLGQFIAQISDLTLKAGYHEKRWTASDLSAGIYLYEIRAESVISDRKYSAVRKMLLVK